MSATYYIGTSGWHYDHWRQRFYPPKLGKPGWLDFYARHFSTVELNNSFYRLPSEAAFANWRDSSPDGFRFAVKVSRFITHIKRLKDVGEPVEKFINRARILGEKLGPLLYQLPPNMHRDDGRLESFLSILPTGLKHVVEFRHESWLEKDFAYIRFHGSEGLYSSCYSDDELADWAKRLTVLGENSKEIYIYFNNDAEGFAIRNAMTIGEYLQKEAG